MNFPSLEEIITERKEKHQQFLKDRIDNQYVPEVIVDGSHPNDPDAKGVAITDEEKWNTAEYIVDGVDDIDILKDMLCNSLYEQFRDLDPRDTALEHSLIDSFMEMYSKKY